MASSVFSWQPYQFKKSDKMGDLLFYLMENGITSSSSSRHVTDRLNLNMRDIRTQSSVLWFISIATGVQCYLQRSHSMHVCSFRPDAAASLG